MITKYGTVDSQVSKTAEGRADAEQQRKTAEKKKASDLETAKIVRKDNK